MSPARRGMVDTNILVLRRWIAPAELPDELAISAVTLAELSAGPRGVDLMIAATAIGAELPLFTTNPADFDGMDELLRIVPVNSSRPRKR